MKKIFVLSVIMLVGVFQSMNAQNEADSTDILIVPQIFDEVKFGGNGLMEVTTGGKKGVVNAKGKVVVPIKYDGIGIPKYNVACDNIIVYNDIVRDGKETYVEGLYNTEGVMTIPMDKYRFIKTYDDYSFEGMAEANMSDGSKCVIFKNGTISEPYRNVEIKKGGVVIVSKESRKGLINKNGDILIPFQYEDIYIRKKNDNLIEVETPYQNGGRKYGIYNIKGEVVVPVGKYQSLSIESTCIEVKQDNKKGVLNMKGMPIVPIGKYESCYESECRDNIHYYISVGSNGKKGVVNKNGKLVFPLGKYDDYSVINEDIIIVSSGGKYGVIDTNGTEIIPIGKYDKLSYRYGVFVNCQNGKYGILDKRGNQVLPIEYEVIDPARHSFGMAFIKKDGKIGVVDYSGKIIMPLDNYTDGSLENGFGYLKKDDKTVFFKSDGEILAPLGKYEECITKYGKVQERKLEHGLFKVVKNGKVGVIKLW